MDWILPKKIHTGMRIAFVAPASASNENLQDLVDIGKERGYEVVFAGSALRQGLYGGSQGALAEELNSLFRDDSIDAIVCLRGGYGSMRYVDRLDFEAIAQSSKPFVGYSDITAIHMAIQSQCHMVTYHGPMGLDWCKSRDSLRAGSEALRRSYEEDVDQLFATLEGRVDGVDLLGEGPRGLAESEPLEGILLGGNMTVLTMMGGTPYGLDAYSPERLEETILFLEDVGEAPYKLDRMLQNLRLQGLLKHIKGLVLGTFLDCQGDKDEADYNMAQEALNYMLEGRHPQGPKPFVCHVPTGHGSPHKTLPLGGRVRIHSHSNRLVFMPYCK